MKVRARGAELGGQKPNASNMHAAPRPPLTPVNDVAVWVGHSFQHSCRPRPERQIHKDVTVFRMSRLAVLPVLLVIIGSAIAQILTNLRITRRFIAKSVVAPIVYALCVL